MGLSKIQQAIEAVGPEAFAREWEKVPEDERIAAGCDWRLMARPEQLAPAGDWDTWLVLAGRGFGKSRSGAEWVRGLAESGQAKRIALVARTSADARDIMVEGESGIVAVSPAWCRPVYEPSKRRLTWPNGTIATTYTAEEPELLRGPQHDFAWCDELAAWRYPATWDQLRFGLRLGARPRVMVTTTPRPTELVKRILKDPRTVVTRGHTYDNAINLAPSFLATVKKEYEGTRLGRQELAAELLEDNPAALWKLSNIDAARIRLDAVPQLRRVVVAVDPAVSHEEGSDETGIVVAGVADCACKGAGLSELHGFVIADASGTYTPAEWAAAVSVAYRQYEADRVVAEVNQGGALVESNLRGSAAERLSYKAIHASQGKRTRAEPVASLYETGRVHHVGSFAKLEDQMTSWNPIVDRRSPDRMDALVYALSELMLVEAAPRLRAIGIRSPGRI